MKSALAAVPAALVLGGCVLSEPASTPSPDAAPGIVATAVADRVVDPDDLVFLREEEKLARDVYLTLGALWDVPEFANIAGSEQAHMDAVLRLLVAYRIPDPIADDTIGVFVNPTLDALYDDLVAAGEGSLLGALTVGATIEDLDLNDIQGMVSRNTARDAARVLDALACGSRNHLRAFVAELALIGADYDAQYLTPAELEAILAGDHERCGGW